MMHAVPSVGERVENFDIVPDTLDQMRHDRDCIQITQDAKVSLEGIAIAKGETNGDYVACKPRCFR